MQQMSADSGRFTLYGTSACHLCELAEDMLRPLCAAAELEYTKVDISESDELFRRYGVRIPVLADSRGRELDWPFSPEQLRVFCSA